LNDVVPLFLADDTLPAFVVVVVAPTKSSIVVVKHFLRLQRAASLPVLLPVLLVPKPLKQRFSDATEEF